LNLKRAIDIAIKLVGSPGLLLGATFYEPYNTDKWNVPEPPKISSNGAVKLWSEIGKILSMIVSSLQFISARSLKRKWSASPSDFSFWSKISKITCP